MIRIGYCTNVHPGRTLAEAMEEIERHAPRVRERLIAAGALATTEALDLGLWLSSRAAHALAADPAEVERFAARLRVRRLRVLSLNGFPYGPFHSASVKRAVYAPGWDRAERLQYTLHLAEAFASLRVLEGRADESASISTVPLGWRPEILAGGGGAALGAAAANLEQLVRMLARLEDRTGVRVRVDLEPEPGCFLDTVDDVVRFFEQSLRPRRGDPDPRRYLGVCHDVCHAAVMWESQARVIERLHGAGIRIGRVQLSSALESRLPEQATELARFDEPRYLHQTTWLGAEGALRFFDDIPDALAALDCEDGRPSAATLARTHMHVPLAVDRAGRLHTTRGEITEFLRAWPATEALPLMEVETYTWSVLPPSMQPATLADGIADELLWAHEEVRRVRDPVRLEHNPARRGRDAERRP